MTNIYEEDLRGASHDNPAIQVGVLEGKPCPLCKTNLRPPDSSQGYCNPCQNAYYKERRWAKKVLSEPHTYAPEEILAAKEILAPKKRGRKARTDRRADMCPRCEYARPREPGKGYCRICKQEYDSLNYHDPSRTEDVKFDG